MSWNDDLSLSIKAQSIQDNIYRRVFGCKDIKRYSNNEMILDIKYHIDVEIKLQNDSILLGQEKMLRNCFYRYNTFTMEFYQNRHTKEQGEFFNLGAQFYLHGYWNISEDGYACYYLIKIFDLLTWLKTKSISELELMTRPSTSNASFFYINYNDIPNQYIYCKDIV